MSFDCSRFSFDPKKNFLGVVMQQGRVALDADWNEWVDQLARRLQAGTLDSLGPLAVPRETPDAFRIRWVSGGLTIGAGRAYVDGILAENHGRDSGTWSATLAEPTPSGTTAYTSQPFYPSPPPLPATSGPHLVYLDVWRRDLTHLQDPGLVEQAVGVDTTGRWQMVWQVKVLPNWPGGACTGADLDLGTIDSGLRPSDGRLSVATGAPPKVSTPCLLPPAAGYKGLENQLYRVEVHHGGPIGTATFKWSRDNAAVASRVSALPAEDRLVVESLGRDELLAFHDGDWIEVTDRRRELHNLPGELRRIRPTGGVDTATRTLFLTSSLPAGAFALGDDPAHYVLVRRWDQAGKQYREDGSVAVDVDNPAAGGAIPVPPAGTRVFLENGILIEFHLPAGGRFRNGDYWSFAARSADGSLETLDRAPPRGIHHHYAPLAVIRPELVVADERVPMTPPTGSVQVCAVQAIDGAGALVALRPGHAIPINQLQAGVTLSIRQRIDPTSLNDGTLFVTTEIPYRLPGAYSGAPVGPVVAYQSVVLPAQVRLAAPDRLTWTPFGQTISFLGDLLDRDVSRLGNVRLESEFEIFDQGGPQSRWRLAPGNLVMQTATDAGTAPAVGPTVALHRYRLLEDGVYAGLSADLAGTGSVGMVFNWADDRNYSMFFLRQFWQPVGFSGAVLTVILAYARVRKGKIADRDSQETTLTAGQSSANAVSLDIKRAGNRLQFGGRVNFPSGTYVERQNLGWELRETELAPETRLGLMTSGNGGAQFTRLQVNYAGQAPITLVPAGVAQRLLARLVLKRSLLAVLGPGGMTPAGAFAPPVPEADYETWFWITPPVPGYGYRSGYRAGAAFSGIGVERLIG